MNRTDVRAFGTELEREARENILAPWMEHSIDERNGGFVGFADRTWTRDLTADKAGILNTRILWTFSHAYRSFGDERYKAVADRAFSYIADRFIDPEYGGIFWDLTFDGRPRTTKKQIYAQAFAVYAFSEYFLATGTASALAHAEAIFALIEEKSRDRVGGGYIEACSRDWKAVGDMRLSEIDMNTPKSMNTHLHILEAYTNLRRAKPGPAIAGALRDLIRVTIDRIVDPRTAHFILFSDMDWKPMSDHVSYGHDIEGSWLLYEAAEVLGDPAVLEEAKALSVKMAEAVLREGISDDGSVVSEAGPSGRLSAERDWWPQAEGMTGFFNAWELTGDARYLKAALGCWNFIRTYIVDREYGEWVWGVDGEGKIYRGEKLGPWKCPYHNARACLEIRARSLRDHADS